MRGETYNIGQQVTIEGTFRVGADPDTQPPTLGTLANPTVVCTLREPDGTITTLSTTNPSTGVFRATFTPDQDGDHWYRFEGTGAAVAADEGYFGVRKKKVAA